MRPTLYHTLKRSLFKFVTSVLLMSLAAPQHAYCADSQAGLASESSVCQGSQTGDCRADWQNDDKPVQQWDTTRYQTEHDYVFQYGASLIDLAAPFTPGERILDIGCGTGELTAALYERAANSTNGPVTVVGMDADPSMIAKASEQYPHLTFLQADVRSFDLSLLISRDDAINEDPRVDLIFSNAAFHWIPPVDVGRAVASIARALKPGGRLVVEFGGAGNVKQIVQACEEVTGVPSFWYYPSIADFSTVLQEHGIEVTTAMLYDRPVLLGQGEEGMKSWLRMFGNKFFQNMASLSSSSVTFEQQMEEAIQKIEDKLRPKLFDGLQWTADYRRIRVIGRKNV